MNTCACGCGQQTQKEQNWIPGHDHRAIHERIKRDHGNVARFIEWYDAVYAKKAKAALTRANSKMMAAVQADIGQ